MIVEQLSRISKILQMASDRALEFLMFGYYIRSILEINQFMLVSTINEIYFWNSSGTFRIISVSIAIIWLIVCLSIIGIVATLALSSYQIDENHHNKLEEFFVGIKSENKFQLYVAFMLLRVTVYVAALITLSIYSSRIVIGMLSLLQVGYWIYSAILRPMIETKANIILIINEAYFIFILGSLAYFNLENDWSFTSTMIYVWTLGSNTLVTFVLILSKPNANDSIVDEVRRIVSWVISKCPKHAVGIHLIFNRLQKQPPRGLHLSDNLEYLLLITL